MNISHGGRDRDQQQKTVYSDGAFSWEYESDFAKDVPAAYSRASIAGGCCDADGNVYLGARMSPNSCIIKLDPEGHFIKAFGQELLSDYLHFTKITPEGTVLCADTHHHVVREFDQDGVLIRDLGNYDHPSDTGFDMGIYARERRSGFMFPTEPAFGIFGMWAMATAMQHIVRIGEPFNMPTDVDLLSDGRIVVSDGYGNHAVHIFTRDGKHLKTFGGHGVWDGETDTPGKFLCVHALCVDPNDHIWICDREKNAVHVLDTDGNPVGYCSRNLGQPSGVDTDGTYVYVIGRGGYLTVFDLECRIVATLGTFNCDLRAHDVAADRNGNLFLFPTHANEDHQVIALHRLS